MQETVIITGATAGIGKELAYEFANKGYHLGLTARRLNMLEDIKKDIETRFFEKGVKVDVAEMDVNIPDEIPGVLSRLRDKTGLFDILIVNAGINSINRVGTRNFEVDKGIIQTNLIGAMATVDAAVEMFKIERKGHIVGISSLAALRGIPTQAAYCASKAGFSIYLDSIRAELKPYNIHVTKILPGFVITDIVENISRYPFAVTAKKAAQEMVVHIEKVRKLGVVPAFPWKYLKPFFSLTPDWVIKKLG